MISCFPHMILVAILSLFLSHKYTVAYKVTILGLRVLNVVVQVLYRVIQKIRVICLGNQFNPFLFA